MGSTFWAAAALLPLVLAYEVNKTQACAPPADKCAKKAEGKCKCKKKRCCAWTGAACAADPLL